MANSIFVLGDSHARSFAFNKSFTPLFLGQGKEINFTSEQTLLNIIKASSSILDILSSQDSVITFFGEPDTRYYLNAGWYPWDNQSSINLSGFEAKIEASIRRYSEFIRTVNAKFNGKLFVLNVIPSNRKEQNIIVDYFNSKLSELCSELGLHFLDINEEIYTDITHTTIREEYVSDHVHLNNKIQLLVQEELRKLGLNVDDGYSQAIQWNNSSVQQLFYFDEKFGCFKMKTEEKTKTLTDITCNSDDWTGNFKKGLEVLHKTGVVRIPGYFNSDTITVLNQNFEQLLNMTSGGVRKIDYSNGRAVTVDLNALSGEKFPAMFEVFRNEKFDAITKAYLKRQDVKANNSVYVVNDVVGTRHMANDLHFDVQRTLKFFVYLNDCNASNGAFACVPGSQTHTAHVRLSEGDKVSYENRMMSRDLPVQESDIVSVDGPAGTLIIFDTDVFHRTGTVTEGERRVMRGQSNFIDELNNPNLSKKKKGWLSGLFGK